MAAVLGLVAMGSMVYDAHRAGQKKRAFRDGCWLVLWVCMFGSIVWKVAT